MNEVNDGILKSYFVCRGCGERYEKEVYRCEICGGKNFKIKELKED